jgi:hypothetical protein
LRFDVTTYLPKLHTAVIVEGAFEMHGRTIVALLVGLLLTGTPAGAETVVESGAPGADGANGQIGGEGENGGDGRGLLDRRSRRHSERDPES